MGSTYFFQCTSVDFCLRALFGNVPTHADDFIPAGEKSHEEWSGEKSVRVVQVKRFMPFLEGNRQCIGMSLAKLNYTTAVAVLLSHFSFRLADDVSASSTNPFLA